MSVTVLMLAALLSSAPPADVENQNDCWQDTGRSGGAREWGRYDYHLVNRCDREIYVWDAIVFWRNDGTEDRWSCGHGTATRDETEQYGCRPRKVRPGGTVSYSARSGARYWFFACHPEDAKCNELGKQWSDSVHGMATAFDPGEVARRMGYSLRRE